MNTPSKEGTTNNLETEIIIWWKCSFPSCDWKQSGRIPYWKALPQFGNHNSEKHGGTVQAHMFSDKGFPEKRNR